MFDDSSDFVWEAANHEVHPAAKRFLKFTTVYENETLRGKMLVTMGFIEDLLAQAIKSFLVNDNEAVLKGFASRSLGSASAKFNMAFLLGLIDDHELKIIEKMAKIRNEFAHQPFVRADNLDLSNHFRNLAKLIGTDQYKEKETDNYAEEVWGMTIWALVTPLMNRPERAEERRLKFQDWDTSAP